MGMRLCVGKTMSQPELPVMTFCEHFFVAFIGHVPDAYAEFFFEVTT